MREKKWFEQHRTPAHLTKWAAYLRAGKDGISKIVEIITGNKPIRWLNYFAYPEEGYIQASVKINAEGYEALGERGYKHYNTIRPYFDRSKPTPQDYSNGVKVAKLWLSPSETWPEVVAKGVRLGEPFRGICRQKDKLGIRYITTEAARVQELMLPEDQRIPPELIDMEVKYHYLVQGFPEETTKKKWQPN